MPGLGEAGRRAQLLHEPGDGVVLDQAHGLPPPAVEDTRDAVEPPGGKGLAIAAPDAGGEGGEQNEEQDGNGPGGWLRQGVSRAGAVAQLYSHQGMFRVPRSPSPYPLPLYGGEGIETSPSSLGEGGRYGAGGVAGAAEVT